MFGGFQIRSLIFGNGVIEISGKVESGRPFLRILSSYCCRFEYPRGVSKVEVYHASCSWMGVTYKEDKEKVKSSIMDFVERELYPNPLF